MDSQPASGCPGTSPMPFPTSCGARSSSGSHRWCGSSSRRPAPRRKTSSQTSQLPDVLVADANVLLSALIGGRAADALAELGPARVRAAEAVSVELSRWLPKLAAKRKLDLNLLLAAMQVLPVRWCGVRTYAWLERWARQVMAGRDEDDWPTVALTKMLVLSSDGLRRPVIPLTWAGNLSPRLWRFAFAPDLRAPARSVAIWSQDKDFEVTDLPRWTTGQVLRALGY